MTYPSNSDAVAQDQIRAFVDRILRLKEEARAINGDIREVYAEAKGNGFDKTILGKLVSYVEKRQSGAADLMEAEALFDLYLSAYDGATGTKVATHTHEEEFDPETGEITNPVANVGEEANGAIAAASDDPASREVDAGQHQALAASGFAGADEPGRRTPVSAEAGPGTISEPETAAPLPQESVSEPGDRRAEASPAATVVPIRSHNPETHFLNSKGLQRLHGCLKAEACGSPEPRKRLCFDCSRLHDGPAQNGEVA